MDIYLSHLLNEYKNWMSQNNLQLEGSAEENLSNPSLSRRQREWLYSFAWKWEIAEGCYEVES